MQWEQATNIILIAAFAVLAVFAVMGLAQLIKRKSLKKVDRTLTGMFFPLAMLAIIYFVFDKLWIVATRPNGSGESSFPSTHVMITATIFFLAMLALPKYIKNKPLTFALDLVMLTLITLTAVGRVAANLHWVSDVICGIVFAFVLAGFYYLITKGRRPKYIDQPPKKGKNV